MYIILASSIITYSMLHHVGQLVDEVGRAGEHGGALVIAIIVIAIIVKAIILII